MADYNKTLHPQGTSSDNIYPLTKWGNLSGTLSNQTDLQTALNGKQATLASNDNVIQPLYVNTGELKLNYGNGLKIASDTNALEVKTKTDGGITMDATGISVTPATTTTIGGIMVGAGLSIDANGVLSVSLTNANTQSF